MKVTASSIEEFFTLSNAILDAMQSNKAQETILGGNGAQPVTQR